MGTQISGIIPKKEIEFKDLKGKKIGIDAFNMIYQFLSTIRQYDGTPLKDSKGRITSHLSGLFYRNINFFLEGILPVWIFDGKPPEMKEAERKNREERKEEAAKKYEKAKEKKDIEAMGKYAKQTVKITDEIINQSKKLLKFMGLPVIQAPSEGEAQATFLAKSHDVYAVASQDFDSLLFGAPYLIRNLGLSRKRKTSSGVYIPIEIELIDLENVLTRLRIDYEQLICLGILVGTDYNPGGVFQIGQKKALDIVKRKKTPVEIFELVEWILKQRDSELNFDWHKIFQIFKKPDVKKSYSIEFKKLDEKKVKEFLCKEHDFSESRVENALKKLKEFKKKQSQADLEKFF